VGRRCGSDDGCPLVSLMYASLIEEGSNALRRAKAEAEERRQAWKERKGFYRSRPWQKLRYEVLRERGNKCECCGRSPPEVILDVDHVLPRSKYPELALVKSNMQILCRDENHIKSNKDFTDWRK
jgi:5-methylcytosine-specific restriction endonuclease McrA